jgi:hypothetical protein
MLEQYGGDKGVTQDNGDKSEEEDIGDFLIDYREKDATEVPRGSLFRCRGFDRN